MKNNKHDRIENKFGKIHHKIHHHNKQYDVYDEAWDILKKLPFNEYVKYYNKTYGFLPYYCGGKDKGYDPHYDRHSRKYNRDLKRTEFNED